MGFVFGRSSVRSCEPRLPEYRRKAFIERLGAIALKTVRGRERAPALVRNRAKLAVDRPVYETSKLGYLIDTIYLRAYGCTAFDVARAT
jgi:hypothetical protein